MFGAILRRDYILECSFLFRHCSYLFSYGKSIKKKKINYNMVSETVNVLETVFFRVFTGRTFVIEAVHGYNG